VRHNANHHLGSNGYVKIDKALLSCIKPEALNELVELPVLEDLFTGGLYLLCAKAVLNGVSDQFGDAFDTEILHHPVFVKFRRSCRDMQN
jgi:hypothetical protein